VRKTIHNDNIQKTTPKTTLIGIHMTHLGVQHNLFHSIHVLIWLHFSQLTETIRKFEIQLQSFKKLNIVLDNHPLKD
jgi:hypothetical protein